MPQPQPSKRVEILNLSPSVIAFAEKEFELMELLADMGFSASQIGQVTRYLEQMLTQE